MELLYITLIVIADQLTKYLAKIKLSSIYNFDIISGFFSLTFVQNRGAAFGIFRSKRILLIGVTALVICLMIYYLIKNKKLNKWIRLSLILIIAGAIGNLIDRIFLSYVVDFIHFYIGNKMDFPVFNIADMSIVFGTIILAVSLIISRE